jgi:hypothetical protein
MNTPIEKLIEHAAEQDALAGLHQGKDALAAHLGKRPEWNTDEHPEHALTTETLNKRPLLSDLHAQRESEDERIAQAGEPPSFLFWKILIAAFVEIVGSTVIMTNAGFEVPMNIVGGVALAIAIFALVSLTNKTRDYRSYLVIAMLVVVSCAVASLRAREAVGEDADTHGNEWALGVVALVMTIGPALWAEPALRKLGLLFPHLRRRKRVHNQLTKLQRDITAAEEYSANHKKSQLHWDDQSHRLKAAYDIAYARKRAEIGSTDPTR